MASGSIVGLNLIGAVGEQPDFLASHEILPYVFALRGDRDWKKAPEKWNGRPASPLVQDLWNIVQREGRLTLAQACSALGREVTEAAALRAMNELWQSFRLSPVLQAPGEPALWEPLALHFAAALARGASSSQVTAISVLASTYLQSVYAATAEEVEVFLSPIASRSRTREALRGLSATGQIHSLTLESHTYLFQDLSLFSPKEVGLEDGVEAAAGAAEAARPAPAAEQPAAQPALVRRSAATPVPSRNPQPALRPATYPARPAGGDPRGFAAKAGRQGGDAIGRDSGRRGLGPSPRGSEYKPDRSGRPKGGMPARRGEYRSAGRGAQVPRPSLRPAPGPEEGSGSGVRKPTQRPVRKPGAQRFASGKPSYGPPKPSRRFGSGAGRGEEPVPAPARGRRYGADESRDRAPRQSPGKWQGKQPANDPRRGATGSYRRPSTGPSTGAPTRSSKSSGARDWKGPQGRSRNAWGKTGKQGYGKRPPKPSPGGFLREAASAGPARPPGDRRASFRRESPARGMRKDPRRGSPGDRERAPRPGPRPGPQLGPKSGHGPAQYPKDFSRRPRPNRGQSARPDSAVKGGPSRELGDAVGKKSWPSPGTKPSPSWKPQKPRPAGDGWKKQRGGARQNARKRRPESP